MENPRIALVLGSGAARGLAHIGVIKVLEKNKIPI
ncbi:MAG: patatin-like phospholipase family protein, partial [Candidatus Neomarinimicrobiota bacterium]